MYVYYITVETVGIYQTYLRVSRVKESRLLRYTTSSLILFLVYLPVHLCVSPYLLLSTASFVNWDRIVPRDLSCIHVRLGQSTHARGNR